MSCVIVLLFTSMPVLAYDFCVEWIYYNKVSESNKVEVTYGDEFHLPYIGDIVIPSNINYDGQIYEVIGIGSSAFYDCPSVASVVLPNTITYINDRAFYCCTGLQSITLPEMLNKIGEKAFYNCFGLTSIDFPNSLVSIDNEAFRECYSLSNIDLPNSLSSLGDAVFQDCINLESVDLSNSLTCLSEEAFRDCKKLNSITLPSSLRSIEFGCFDGCESLESVNLPNSLTYIGVMAFSFCSSLKSVVIPSSITSIESGTFSDCENLTSITIPNSISSIGDYSFSYCRNLTTIEIPSSVTSLGQGAFCNCFNLESITLPKSLTSIQPEVFRGCSKLTTLKIPHSVATIGMRAFQDCNKLVSVSLPESLNAIYEHAFEGCESLERLDIPKNVYQILRRAFSSCKGLKSIKVNNPDPSEIYLGSTIFEGVSKSESELYVPRGSKPLYESARVWKEFENIYEFDESRTLIDKEPYDLDETLKDMLVYYTRNFENTDWQGLYIPFDMSYEEWSPYAEVAELAGIIMYDDDKDGIPDRTNIEFITIKEGKIIPSLPYLIKAHNPGTVEFECQGKTLKAAPEYQEENGSVSCSSPRWEVVLTGTYEERPDLLDRHDIFTIKDNKFIPNNEVVSPYRFYLELKIRNNSYWGAPGTIEFPKEIEITVDGVKVSGIDNIFVDDQNYGLDSDCNRSYYDLQGRKIDNPSRGLYIHNGKVVLIKD